MNADDVLPLSLQQKLDQVCKRFEGGWKTGAQPRIEDHLADLADVEKREVLRELVLLDVFYRRKHGESCQLQDYQARFPQLAADWLAQVMAADAMGAAAETIGISSGETTSIGPYKLLEQIGEGGFGIVFMAEQTEPVRRKVALKILKPGMDTRQVVARFEAERQALAIMDHPNIARVFDGGATPSGRPYFVMELVKGVPITDFCDQNHLTPRQRLELFMPVCQAVQHAHQKGIIHRDLKPSNVLVSRHDTTPVVKVIDFGVAKALGQQLTDKTLFTGIAQMIGTPLYMSPEQAGMSDLDVDTRSDIYSLRPEAESGTVSHGFRKTQGSSASLLRNEHRCEGSGEFADRTLGGTGSNAPRFGPHARCPGKEGRRRCRIPPGSELVPQAGNGAW